MDDDIVAPNMVIPTGTITDSVVVSVRALDYLIELSDTIQAPAMAMSFGVITDAINITFYVPTFAIISEDDEFNIVSEDGDYNICSG